MIGLVAPPAEGLLEVRASAQPRGGRLVVDIRARSLGRSRLFLQNQFGPPTRYPIGSFGGGRSPNVSGVSPGFSTRSAYVLPLPRETALVFQGESPRSRGGCPAFSALDEVERSYAIELSTRMLQWENEAAPLEEGPEVTIRRLLVCVEALIDPEVVEQMGDVYACEHGQPALIELVVPLTSPLTLVVDARSPHRGEELLGELRTFTRIGRPPGP